MTTTVASDRDETDYLGHLSFRLSDRFVESYRDKPVPWGFNIGGDNSLGELTWVTKYARKMARPGEDGPLERWYQGCRRIVEGMYSLQKDWCSQHLTPWNHAKAARSAEDCYDRLFHFKWTPPGRGLWMMGTEFVWEEGSGALQNCAFLSTENISVRQPSLKFERLMEMSMLGVGVGFDILGADKLTIHQPKGGGVSFRIPDSREGWCESVALLLNSYLLPGQHPVEFIYDDIRQAGQPLKRFGGKAAGPMPLMRLHKQLRAILDGRDHEPFSGTDIADCMNLIGKCVVAGNIRRSAELALGRADDKDYLNLKNYIANPERMGVVLDPNDETRVLTGEDGKWVHTEEGGWGHLSNNSVFAEVGGDYDHLAEAIALNGEPGLFYLDLARSHGRLIDPANNRDYRAKGANPCVEQTLEDFELCTLVETYPTAADDLEDYRRTLKYAFMYAKAVTLLPTHWPESNEVMQRNRRIGCSMTGIAQFAEHTSTTVLRDWCEAGFETINYYDTVYSEWLGVRESIKKTSVKPSGTVARLKGVTAGVHFPTEGGDFIRRDRYSKNDPVVAVLAAAGYHVEPSVSDPEADVVVTFPVHGLDIRSEREVSVWEKAHLATLMQRHWADNQVSVTLSFRPDEGHDIARVIRSFDGQLKSMSFLPLGEEMSAGAYAQMPFERATPEKLEKMFSSVKPIDWTAIYESGRESEGEAYCSNDVCELPTK